MHLGYLVWLALKCLQLPAPAELRAVAAVMICPGVQGMLFFW